MAQPVSAPRAYLNSALALMKAHSINRKTLNWKVIYDFAYQQSEKSSTITEIYPVIDTTLTLLNDQHSSFYPPEKVAGIFKGYRANGEEPPKVLSKIIRNTYAYLKVPHFYFANEEEWEEFVTDAYDKMKKLDRLNLKGWIIDLRDNDGGMLTPILGAIAPFINGSQAIGIKDADGVVKHYYYSENAVKYGDSVIYRFKTPLIKLNKMAKPTVVLINQHTGSSGEFAAAAFIGRNATRLMGTKTNGLTSSNTEFRLGDGAYLVLTNGTLIDQRNHDYSQVGAGIEPDIALSLKDTVDGKIFNFAIKAMK